MPRSVVALLDNPDGRDLVREACKSRGIGFPEFQELVQAVVEQTGKQRRAGMGDAFDDILDRIQPDE